MPQLPDVSLELEEKFRAFAVESEVVEEAMEMVRGAGEGRSSLRFAVGWDGASSGFSMFPQDRS